MILNLSCEFWRIAALRLGPLQSSIALYTPLRPCGAPCASSKLHGAKFKNTNIEGMVYAV